MDHRAGTRPEQGGPDEPGRGVVDVKDLARLAMLLVQDLAEQHGLLRDLETGIAANKIDRRLTPGARVLVRFGHGVPPRRRTSGEKKKRP
jgi:hypothetical protein